MSTPVRSPDVTGYEIHRVEEYWESEADRVMGKEPLSRSVAVLATFKSLHTAEEMADGMRVSYPKNRYEARPVVREVILVG